MPVNTTVHYWETSNHDQHGIVLSILSRPVSCVIIAYIPAGPAPITQYWVAWSLAKAAQTAPRQSKVIRNIKLLAISPEKSGT